MPSLNRLSLLSFLCIILGLTKAEASTGLRPSNKRELQPEGSEIVDFLTQPAKKPSERSICAHEPPLRKTPFSPSSVAGAVKDSYILDLAADLVVYMRKASLQGNVFFPTFESVRLSREGMSSVDSQSEFGIEYWSYTALMDLKVNRKTDLLRNSFYALGVFLYKLKHGAEEHPLGVTANMSPRRAADKLMLSGKQTRTSLSVLDITIEKLLQLDMKGACVLLKLGWEKGSKCEGWSDNKKIYGEVQILEEEEGKQVEKVNLPELPLPAVAGLLSASYLFKVAEGVVGLISSDARPAGRRLIPTDQTVRLTAQGVEWRTDGDVPPFSVEYLSTSALKDLIDGLPLSQYSPSTPFFALGILLSKLERGLDFHPLGVTPSMSPMQALHTSSRNLRWFMRNKGISPLEDLIAQLLSARIVSEAAFSSEMTKLGRNLKAGRGASSALVEADELLF